MSMKFSSANESPRKGGAHTDEQMKARVKATHQFEINRSTSARRQVESPPKGCTPIRNKWINKCTKVGKKPTRRWEAEVHIMNARESKIQKNMNVKAHYIVCVKQKSMLS
jgi:hypothetical protein